MNILKNWGFILLVILLVGLALIQLLYKKAPTNPLTNIPFIVLSEIQTAGVNFHKSCSDIVRKYFFLLDLREENKKLNKQNKELMVQQMILGETLKENKRLKQSLNWASNKVMRLELAQIIGTDWLSKNQLLTINKGSRQGIKKSMGVLSPQGVLGYVFRVSPNSSQVITLLNPLSSLPARHKKSRLTGLISSDDTKNLTFDLIDHTTDKNLNFNEGDQIITLKTDQFPAGLLVGTLESWEHSKNNPKAKFYIQPSAPFYSLEEVFVILSPSPKTN